jgi:hypothetical protein
MAWTFLRWSGRVGNKRDKELENKRDKDGRQREDLLRFCENDIV